jgi:branched-chain amino acid transport system substrate-binding protein
MLVLALAMVAAACGDSGTTTTTAEAPTATTTAATEAPATTTAATEAPATTAAPADAEPIVIGTSLPLTGEFSVPAIKHRDGYQLCVDLINGRGGVLGRPLELLVEDNRSDTEVAVGQYERFISAGAADVLFGTFSSLITFPTSAVAEQNGWVYPVPSGGAQRIWERGFENLFYFQQGPAEGIGSSPVNAVAYYEEQGVIAPDDAPTKAAVVAADDFFALAISNGLLGGEVAIPGTDTLISLAPGFLADAGIEVVHEAEWPVGEFNDWINLANAIKSSGADIVFASTASVEETISLVDAFQTVDYNPKLLYMSQGAQSEFRDTLGDAANGVIIHTAWHQLANFPAELGGADYSNADFIADFEAEFGRPPDEDEAIPFAVCQGMEQAIRGAGTTDQAAMSQWLRDRTPDDPVKTVMGDFSWDERGLPFNRNYLLTQWQDGVLEFIFPVGEFPGTKDILYPKPEW